MAEETPSTSSLIENVQPSKDAAHLVGTIATGYSGSYKILELIGRGGMSDVYKASIENIQSEDPISTIKTTNVGRIVACKVLLARLLDHKQHYKRFQHEATLAKRLAHPNIVNVYDAGEIDERPFMVLEYVGGRALSDVCKEQGKMPIQRALPIFLQISGAFAYAHLNNIVHRDLKPSNIMLTQKNDRDDFVKVVDFGIAKIASETVAGATQLTKTGDVLGTPSYMSPEQCRGEDIDFRSDIYSLGILMYEVLAGVRPFEGTDSWSTLIKQTSEAPKALGAIDSDILLVKKIERIIFKCLEKEPSARYQKMDDLKHELESVQHQLESGKKNPVLLAVERTWLLLSESVSKVATKLFSFRLSSSGLTTGSVLMIVFSVLALVGILGGIFLFGPSASADIADRELPFRPMADPSVKPLDPEVAGRLWRMLESKPTHEPAVLEYALKVLTEVADSNKKCGNYDVAPPIYYQGLLIVDWLKLSDSTIAANLYNSLADACLSENALIDVPNQSQNEQLLLYIKKYGDLIPPAILRQKALTYAATAAQARDGAYGALTVMSKLDEMKSLPALLAFGFLGESYKELNLDAKAEQRFEEFYNLFTDKEMPAIIAKSETLGQSEFPRVVAFAGRFFLQHSQLNKSSQLLEQAQAYFENLGNLAQYNRAVIYNDLGLVHEAKGESKEAKIFYDRAYALLSSESDTKVKKYRNIVLNNMATCTMKIGDYKSAITSKIWALISSFI